MATARASSPAGARASIAQAYRAHSRPVGAGRVTGRVRGRVPSVWVVVFHALGAVDRDAGGDGPPAALRVRTTEPAGGGLFQLELHSAGAARFSRASARGTRPRVEADLA